MQYNILYYDLEAAGGWIVLQPGGKLCCKGCIVLQVLYCREGGGGGGGGVDELCRNTLKCIVTEAVGLCRDTALQGHDTAG